MLTPVRRHVKEAARPQNREMLATLLEMSDLSEEEVLARLGTSLRGLNDAEAQARLDRFGPNELPEKQRIGPIGRLYQAFVNPFNAILVLLAVVSTFTDVLLQPLGARDPSGVIIILTMVGVSGVLRFVQEWRSDEAVEKLKQLVSLTIAVRRNGEPPRELPARQLVPGDIVHLAAGHMIPADLRILFAKDLFVSQSVLTGESEPVEKGSAPGTGRREGAPSPDPLERHNLAFMGSNVVSGTAVGVVIATGPRTYFGSVARSLTERRGATSFEVGVDQVSRLLIRFMLGMVPG